MNKKLFLLLIGFCVLDFIMIIYYLNTKSGNSFLQKPIAVIVPNNEEFVDIRDDTYMLRRRGTKNGDIYEVIGIVLELNNIGKEIAIGQDNLMQTHKMKILPGAEIRLAQRDKNKKLLISKGSLSDIIIGKTQVIAQCATNSCDQFDKLTILKKQ